MTLTDRRPRRAVTAAAAAVAVAAASLLATPAFADATDPISFDTGHIDAFNLALNDDGSIRLNLQEDVTGAHVQRAPESVELLVKHDAYQENLPAAFLPPGAPTSLWFLPITQDHNLIWPGWNSQGVASEYGADADVDIVVSDVQGPGQVYLWSQGVFGDPVSLLVGGGWSLPATIRQTFLAHVHANWGFTAPGTYTITAQATITSQDGSKTSTSNTAAYTFVVQGAGGGEEPPPSDVTLGVTNVAAHYHTGEVAMLTAVPSEAVSDHYHWFTRATADDEWEVVPGALGADYGFIVTGEHQVKAALYDHDHAVIAESDPVAILIDDHGNTPGVGPEITVSLPEDEGALVISVAAGSESTTLGDLELSPEGDRYLSEGEVTGITVTDTRPGNVGWSSSGRVRSLVSVDGDILDGRYLGWTPEVLSASQGQSVTAGDAVAPGLVTGNGIRGWNVLGSAAAGSSIGTAVLGADLRIEAPTTLEAGEYRGVMLITVI